MDSPPEVTDVTSSIEAISSVVHDDPSVMYQVDIVPEDHHRADPSPQTSLESTPQPTPEKPRKPHRHTGSPGSDNTVVNVINSTKIIIKGLNVNAAAVAANNASRAESPLTVPPVLVKQPPEPLEVDPHPDAEHKPIDDQDENVESSTATPVQRTSTPKISREFMQLQRTVTESKMLTEYMNDTDSRSRKAKRVSTMANQRLADDASDDESVVSSRTSRGGPADRSRSRSRSHNRSPESHSAQSTTTTTPEGRGGPRRNMRSQNAEFSAKHQKFLKGIHQHQESDASDNSDHEPDMDRGSVHSLLDDSATDDLSKDVHLAPQVGFYMIFSRLCHHVLILTFD